MLIAHRGLHHKELENTIPAYEAALAHGADAIETDVCLSDTGHAIVYHSFDIVEKKEHMMTMQDLCSYIKKTGIPFFIELKHASQELAEQVVQHIAEQDIWDKVYVIAFEVFAYSIVAMQEKYPALRVVQLLTFGAYDAAYDKPMPEDFTPKEGLEQYLASLPRTYGISVGWTDVVEGSEKIFKTHFPKNTLYDFRIFAESLGYVVFGGVPNTKADAQYFYDAGIHAIFTDRPDILSA